jgi:hypothetical protein
LHVARARAQYFGMIGIDHDEENGVHLRSAPYTIK